MANSLQVYPNCALYLLTLRELFLQGRYETRHLLLKHLIVVVLSGCISIWGRILPQAPQAQQTLAQATWQAGKA
jgi:hypothetical protein